MVDAMKYLRSWVVGMVMAPVMLPLSLVVFALCVIHTGLECVIQGLGGVGLSLCWVYQKLAGLPIDPYSEFMKAVSDD